MDGPSAQGFLSLTALRAEGCGIALGHTFGVKVLKMDRPDGRKVLKFDGLSGRGLRIALRAMLIKSALRDWLSGSDGMIRITMMSHLRWLFPLARQSSWPVFRRPQGGCKGFFIRGRLL